MNSKDVLNKIAKMLNLTSVELTEAKSADGTILSSPTFDLNESVEEVHEDGTKSPAKDGEYTISLKDESGNENIIRIDVKDGKIVERANEEEEKNEEEMSDAGTPMDPTKGDKEDRKDIDSVPGSKVEDVKLAVTEDKIDSVKKAETKEAHALPNTTDEDPRNRIGEDTDDKKDPIISMSARLDELEAKLAAMYEKMASAYPDEGMEVSSLTPNPSLEMSSEEEDLPKLDGAPVEQKFSLSAKVTPNKKAVEGNYQNSFLAKLYK